MVPAPTPIAAGAVLYSGSASGISATNVQEAIDAVAIRNGLAVPVVCGTATGTGADFDGWIPAAAACNTACSSSAARPCSADDVVHVLQAGGTVTQPGWIFAGMGCSALNSNSGADTGSFWNGATFETRPCNFSNVLLCCR